MGLGPQAQRREDFEGFEREVHALFVEAQREVLAEGLERLDAPREVDTHLSAIVSISPLANA
ncbi:MAG: hypothetical protein ACREV4_10580 [Gammaproteobacteria bacterium]